MKYPAVYDLGVPIHYLIRRTKKDPGLWAPVMRLCREVRPDIIHTWDSMTSVYAAPVAKTVRDSDGERHGHPGAFRDFGMGE